MNRAWIPAGALAGVSVAGLLALAPLTDSLGTNVEFPTSVPVSSSLQKPLKAAVPVSVNLKTVGSLTHVSQAALHTRGGAAAKVNTSGDAGQVGVHIKAPASTGSTEPKASTQAPTEPKAPTPPKAKPKKTPRSNAPITGTTDVNGTDGLAGGNDSETGVGETSNRLGG